MDAPPPRPPASSRGLLIPNDEVPGSPGASRHSRRSSTPHSARDLQHLLSNVSSRGTYAAQDKLPRLPIPDLEETMERFQCRLEALQDEAQREETARVVQEFLESDGPKLQEALRQYEAEGIEEERIGVRGYVFSIHLEGCSFGCRS